MQTPRLRYMLSVMLLGVSAAVGAVPAAADAPRPQPGVSPPTALVPARVLVRLTAAARASGSYKTSWGSQGRTGLPGLDAALAAVGADLVEPLLRFPAAESSEPGLILNRTLAVRLAGGHDPAAAVVRLAAAQEAESVSMDGTARIAFEPDDHFYPDQWAHDNTGQAVAFDESLVGTPDSDTDTDLAWDVTTGDSDVIIAVIDTGIDLTHPEFAGRLLAGYDFYNDDSDPTDDHGHGTACAGIAAAAGGNAQGIAGVAWQSRLLPVKVLNADGESYSLATLMNGIVWAADHGADILSISIGATIALPSPLEDALAYAYGRGCAIFCSAGNVNALGLTPPAYYTAYTIPVGALSPCNERKTPATCDGEDWWGSNHASSCLFAPGVRIATTDIQGGAGYARADYVLDFNGTSAAAPHAAGVGALVLALNPALTPGALEAILLRSCEDLGAGGIDDDTGWGRLNAQLAVLSAFDLPIYCRADYVGYELGTLHLPFNSFPEGTAYTSPGGTLIMLGGDYDLVSPVTLSEPMTIRGLGGVATIHP